MSLQTLVQLASGVVLVPVALWFYPHCARPNLKRADARGPAFIISQIGTLAAVLAGLLYILDAAGVLPRAAIYLPLLLAVVWVPTALGFVRPLWIVRATGGPKRA